MLVTSREISLKETSKESLSFVKMAILKVGLAIVHRPGKAEFNAVYGHFLLPFYDISWIVHSGYPQVTTQNHDLTVGNEAKQIILPGTPVMGNHIPVINLILSFGQKTSSFAKACGLCRVVAGHVCAWAVWLAGCH